MGHLVQPLLKQGHLQQAVGDLCQCEVGQLSLNLLPSVSLNSACSLPSVWEGLFVPPALLWA